MTIHLAVSWRLRKKINLGTKRLSEEEKGPGKDYPSMGGNEESLVLSTVDLDAIKGGGSRKGRKGGRKGLASQRRCDIDFKKKGAGLKARNTD